jgi:undecaprenyl diphosphate synthase
MELARSLRDSGTLPRHVAVIMDGNGRWAKLRHLPRIAGHEKGAEAVRELVKGCRELGIEYLTIFAFSSENWKRPSAEIGDLMTLLRVFLEREIAALDEAEVCVHVIGDRSRLGHEIVDLVESAEKRTGSNEALTLTVALDYGSRSEIVAAARRLAEDVHDGRLSPEDITEQRFGRCLDTAGLPDPDLMIRTSGEQRLSNFLLWQAAYTELVFVPTLWPDFKREHLFQAIDEYQRRERRYGGTGG